MSGLLEGPIDDLLAGALSSPPAVDEPLILVEYRYRGVPGAVVAAVLIVCSALGIGLHRRVTPPPILITRPTTPAPHVPPRAQPEEVQPAQSPPQSRVTAGSPVLAVLALRDQLATAADPGEPAPRREGELNPSPSPSPAADAGRPASAPSEVRPQAETSETHSPPPEPEPRPSTEEVEREILREAEQREAELDELRQLKPEARRLEQTEGPRRALELRLAFRKELYEIVKTAGGRAGERIEELCDQYGCALDPDQRTAVIARLRRSTDRTTCQDRVAILRACGVLEPTILEDLARYWDRRLRNARGGLHDPDEVRVKAARQLLAIPVTSQTGSEAPRP
ncbi:MAG: hypothetical protein P4L84_15950 [Isosphaeraceae bacterium]|nr:hypothetical protein [Isosphaeraceae bacterium]